MSNDSYSTEQFANSAGSRGSAASNNPGFVRPSVKELRNRAILVARAAAAYIASHRVKLGSDGVSASSGTKSSAVDPVTVVNRESEEFVRSLIEVFSSSDCILGEEGGSDDGVGSQAQITDVPELVTWIVDPIGGTVDFLYGPPNFVASIAYAVGDEIVADTVANVYSGEIHCAAKGEGARVPRRDSTVQALSCPLATELEKTSVATGLSYSVSLRQVRGRIASQLLGECQDIRRMGSATLDLCMVAYGRVNAYYERDIKVWDYATGALTVAEAGVRIRIPGFSEYADAAGRPEGDPLNFGVGAANPEVADAFYEALDGVISKARNWCVGLGTGARA